MNNLAAILDHMRAADLQQKEARLHGVPALLRLVPIAQRDTGQSGVVGRFLLSLYNGNNYPFDLTELRRLDLAIFEDCLLLLRMDYQPTREIHDYLTKGEQVFTHLVHCWANRGTDHE